MKEMPALCCVAWFGLAISFGQTGPELRVVMETGTYLSPMACRLV